MHWSQFSFLTFLQVVNPSILPSTSFQLTTYRELTTHIPVGNEGDSSSLPVYIPIKPGLRQIADPATLFQHVLGVWNAVVKENQAGLQDAKQMSTQAPPPISKEEAWHHYRAGQQGIIDSARFLIAFSVVPSVQSGGSQVHTAASHNQVEHIRQLLDTPLADVDATKTTDGTTALFNAVSLGHVEATELLLELGANVNHVANNGIACIHIAAAMGHVPIVQLLINYKVDINYPQNFALTTALHFAGEMGRADVIQLLCENGANPHSRKTTGGTALHTAADTNQTSSVVALLHHCKADPNLLLNKDTTPLYLAAQRGFTSVIQALEQGGANINFIMPHGKFQGALMSTSESLNGKQMYKSKNTEIGNGATALHAAVENGHLKATQILLKLGAVQLTSMQGASPLLIALQYSHPKIAHVLLRGKDAISSAHVNTQTKDGVFPLFVASGAGYVKVVKRLLQVGANVYLKTKQGATALDYATYSKRYKVIHILMEHQRKVERMEL